MIEKRKHVVARMQHRPEFDLCERVRDHSVLVTGATAELEKVDGRWVLAKLELPK